MTSGRGDKHRERACCQRARRMCDVPRRQLAGRSARAGWRARGKVRTTQRLRRSVRQGREARISFLEKKRAVSALEKNHEMFRRDPPHRLKGSKGGSAPAFHFVQSSRVHIQVHLHSGRAAHPSTLRRTHLSSSNLGRARAHARRASALSRPFVNSTNVTFPSPSTSSTLIALAISSSL